MSFLDRFFGPTYEKDLEATKPIIEEINKLESEIQGLSDAEMREKTVELQKKAQSGTSLDDLLVVAFALVRESGKRTLEQRHYDEQLMGGIILHNGKITEMRTGEGKTLVGTLPAYLNSLTEKGVHIITVNDYLARRDAVWMGQIYELLGVSVGVLNQSGSFLYDSTHTELDAERDSEGSYKVIHEFLRPCTRKEAYDAGVTYGTNSEYGFDYLRDNIEFDVENLRQRGHPYAIIDEVDSILIDEARTPLIISAPAQDSENLYGIFAGIAQKLDAGTDYEIDEKLKSATLTDQGVEKAEKALGIENIYTDKGIKYVHHLETAVRAKALYKNNKEYVIKDDEVVIVDEFTGRLQPGRRWSDGLHQAIEAKEGMPIQRESRTYASVTYQNFFKMYEKLSGMTGTALTSQEEFYSVYKLDVIPVPTHVPMQRIDNDDFIFQNERGKIKAIIAKIKEVNKKGQPILIGTASIDKNEELGVELIKAGIVHEMLNAKNHDREGEIIAEAGKKGGVTLATNMAGRGVDIKLGGIHATKEEAEEVVKLGGLFVLGTERHEARRIDDQLRGRSGRQGDPGETQFYVSMDDTLMRVFANETVKNMMGRFGIPEDQPIENALITRSLESAQKKIEGFNFDARKQVLAYDNVVNQQRQIIYEKRHKLLLGTEDDIKELVEELIKFDPEIETSIKDRIDKFGEKDWYKIIRRLMLQVSDMLWVEHLEVMQYTRSSVSLRAYGQQDPLIEYRKEAIRLFKEMQEVALHRIIELIPNIRKETVDKEEESIKKTQSRIVFAGGGESSRGQNRNGQQNSPIRKGIKIGRNELVTITDGKNTETIKFKKAEARIQSGEWKIV